MHTQLLAAGNLLTSQCPAQVEDVCVCLASHTQTHTHTPADLFKECIYISKVTRYIIGGMVPQKSSKEKKKPIRSRLLLHFTVQRPSVCNVSKGPISVKWIREYKCVFFFLV